MEESWSQAPDAQIISACLDGNEKAWHALVQRYKRLVYSIPHKWGLTPDDATDIFQAVWLDCFRQLATLRDLERLHPWLIRVTVRKCHRFSQTSRARGEGPLSDTDEEIAGANATLIDELEREQVLRTAVSRLPPRCMQVIECLFFEDPRPSYQAIAVRLGISENSIGFTRERCLNSLRKILGELGYEP